MLFNLEIKNRVARYIPGDKRYVCGNSGDQLKIAFDSEWSAHDKKTARFIWNGKHYDQEFTGDTVEIPVITKATAFSIGVYAGETAEGEEVLSSTYAVVPCELSIRCVGSGASNGTGANYTNEAKGYALAAEKAAEDAQASAEQTAKYHGMKYMGSATINVSLHPSYTSPNSDGMDMYDALIIDGTYLDKNNNLVLDMRVDAPDYVREKVPVAGDALRNKIYPLFGCTLVRISIHQPYAMEGGSYWETYRSYSEVATGKDDCGYVWHNSAYDTIEYDYSGNKTLLVEWHEYQSASYTGGYICMLHLSNDLANILKRIFEIGTNDFYYRGGYIEIEAFK